MKHTYHSLLPIQLQSNLMATANERPDLLDKVIEETMLAAPNKYHTAKTLGARVFFNEPRQAKTPMAGFIHPVPQGMNRI